MEDRWGAGDGVEGFCLSSALCPLSSLSSVALAKEDASPRPIFVFSAFFVANPPGCPFQPFRFSLSHRLPRTSAPLPLLRLLRLLWLPGCSVCPFSLSASPSPSLHHSTFEIQCWIFLPSILPSIPSSVPSSEALAKGEALAKEDASPRPIFVFSAFFVANPPGCPFQPFRFSLSHRLPRTSAPLPLLRLLRLLWLPGCSVCPFSLSASPSPSLHHSTFEIQCWIFLPSVPSSVPSSEALAKGEALAKEDALA